ncbi:MULTISPECIES: hypothetical protein [Xenorhabdus]|nr:MULTISPECIES: hypothetical protein [Xenorhabdus]
MKNGNTQRIEALKNIEETLPADSDAGWLSGALENRRMNWPC